MTVNLFETTIRVLAGLQSAFVLSGGDHVFLWQALNLGLRMSVSAVVFAESSAISRRNDCSTVNQQRTPLPGCICGSR